MKKILLIEDDSFLSNIYSTKLKEEGISVEIAFDGEEAIRKIKENKPDLVLLDIILPGMSGWDVLKEIRKNKKLDDVKIIILSNIDQDKEINEDDSLKVSKHLVKAYYTPSEIIKEVKEILKK